MTLETIKSLLTEIQARIEHPLPAMRPFEVAFKDPLPREARAKPFGTICKVTFEIDPELYRQIQHGLPEQAILKGVLWMEDIPQPPVKPEPRKKTEPRASKGPWGHLWQYLKLTGGIVNCPGVREAIEAARLNAQEEPWQILHRVFNVASMAEVGPDEFRHVFPIAEYPQANVLLGNAERANQARQP